MTGLRSALYAVCALAWTALLALLYLPLLLLPWRRGMQRAAARWSAGLLALLRWICGLDYRIIGRENLPRGAAVIAAKHQSAWDTLIFHLLLDDPVFVLKRELLAVPVLGWYLAKAGNIAIDRARGVSALRGMLPAVGRHLNNGGQVIVFPEGTRVPPGESRAYHPGIAAIAFAHDVPVIPVALNSGQFWGRRRFRKYPGTICLAFLAPMAKEPDRRQFLAHLKQRIEQATDELMADAAETSGAGSSCACNSCESRG